MAERPRPPKPAPTKRFDLLRKSAQAIRDEKQPKPKGK